MSALLVAQSWFALLDDFPIADVKGDVICIGVLASVLACIIDEVLADAVEEVACFVWAFVYAVG